jgi:site-specific DNA recombinase
VRAAIYARVSTSEQARGGTSIGTQLERCRAEAERRGYEVVDEFVEEGVSGTKENRPERDRLLDLEYPTTPSSSATSGVR